MSTKHENWLFSVLLLGSTASILVNFLRNGSLITLPFLYYLVVGVGVVSLIMLILQGSWKFIATIAMLSVIIVAFYFIPNVLPFFQGIKGKIALGIISASSAVGGFFALVFYYLAPRNRWYTFIKEGTAKAIVKGDKVEKILMQWEGYTLDRNGYAIPTNEWTKKGKVLQTFTEAKTRIPLDPNDLSQIQHFSYRKAEDLIKKLKSKSITSIDQLETAAKDGDIQREVDGFGKKTEEKILEFIENKENNDNLFEPKRKAVKQNGEEASTPFDADRVIIVFQEVEKSDDDVIKPQKEDDHLFGGLRFYGWLHPLEDVYIYKFSWTSVGANGKTKEHNDKVLDYIMLKEDIYKFTVSEAEDKENLPLMADITVPMKIINPKKALFEVENWLEMVTNRNRPAVRDALSTDKYEEHTSNKQDLSSDIFATIVGRGLIEEFEDQYGVRVRRTEVAKIDPTEEFRDVTLAPKKASLEKKARVTKAEGEAAAIKAVSEVLDKHGANAWSWQKMKEVDNLSVFAGSSIGEAFSDIFDKDIQNATSGEKENFWKLLESYFEKQKSSAK